MENNKQIYRLEYEDGIDKTQVVYIFLDDKEYAQAQTEVKNVVKFELATEEQIEAYTCGFEDGVDVATLKYRLEDYQNGKGISDNFHKPTEEELLDIFRNEEKE